MTTQNSVNSNGIVTQINGTNFTLGSSGNTITAAAGTLTGTTLNSTVVTSSLTSVGTIGTGVWNGTAITDTYGGTIGKKAVLECMGLMISYSTNGATLTQNESSTNKCNYRGFLFAQSGDNYAGFRIPMPASWDQGTFTFIITWTSATTSGNVVWSVQSAVRRSGDSFDIAYGSAVTITSAAPGSAQNSVITAESSAMTPGGTAGTNCELEVRINRNGGAGSDTMAGTAIITSFLLYYTTNSGTP